MVDEFTTTLVISAYHHNNCEFESRSWRVVLDTTLCDKVYQWLVTGPWFSPGTQVSSISKTDRHDITEISFNIINQNQTKPIPCLKPEYNFTYPFMTTIPVDSLSLQVSTLPWVQWHSWNTANVGVKHQSLTFIVSYLLRLLVKCMVLTHCNDAFFSLSKITCNINSHIATFKTVNILFIQMIKLKDNCRRG